MLVDASRKTLIVCPSALEGMVVIPEGISNIGNYAFYGCYKITDVVLPDSLEMISVVAFPTDENQERIRIHCSKNSLAEAWALENDWPYVID